MLCEFDLYSAHLVSIKTAAPSGLVVRHSGLGESSQAVLGFPVFRGRSVSPESGSPLSVPLTRRGCVLEGLREPSESSSLDKVGLRTPRHHTRELKYVWLRASDDFQNLRTSIGGESNSRGGLIFIVATIYVVRRWVYVAGRLSIRRRTFGRSLWDVRTSRVDWLLNSVVGRVLPSVRAESECGLFEFVNWTCVILCIELEIVCVWILNGGRKFLFFFLVTCE